MFKAGPRAPSQRLLTMGYDRHEVLHMLTWVASERLWNALREHRADRPRTL